MKLAIKLVLSVVLVIAIILAVAGIISFRHQRALFERDMQDDIRILGVALREVVTDTWTSNGLEQAWDVIKEANDAEASIDIRWVWMDAPLGSHHGPEVPLNILTKASQGRDQTVTIKNRKESGHFYAYFPIVVEGQRLGGLEFHESLSELDAMDRHALIKTIGSTTGLILFSSLAALLMGVRMVGRPLKQMVQKMRRVGDGDFSGPLCISGHDELDELAKGMNTMCEQLSAAWDQVHRETEARIAAMEQLRHEDRLKIVGKLASGIAHEMGTPLNVISGYANMIARQTPSSSETREMAHTIKDQSERIAATIRQVLDFARHKQGQRTRIDLARLVHQSLDLVRPLAPKQNVSIQSHLPETSVEIVANGEQIRQVLLNLMTNALQAMSEGGTMNVGVATCEVGSEHHLEGPDHRWVKMWVQDEGQGIAPEHLEHIFEPFYTTKETGQGTGLGLSITEGIVKEHGGRIEVNSQPGQGSCFHVYFPWNPSQE